MSSFDQVYGLAVSGQADALQALALRGGLDGFSRSRSRKSRWTPPGPDRPPCFAPSFSTGIFIPRIRMARGVPSCIARRLPEIRRPSVLPWTCWGLILWPRMPAA